LIARALGAAGMILTEPDQSVKESIERINDRWGSKFFVEIDEHWRKRIAKIKQDGDTLVHLTMYGLRLDKDVSDRIKALKKDIYVFVGSQKVPSEIYHLADYNISISNQPQSECGALAIFLDRIFEGETLYQEFPDAKYRIIPDPSGKNVEVRDKD